MIENVKIRQTPCIFFIIRRNPTKYPKSYQCRIIRQVTHTGSITSIFVCRPSPRNLLAEPLQQPAWSASVASRQTPEASPPAGSGQRMEQPTPSQQPARRVALPLSERHPLLTCTTTRRFAMTTATHSKLRKLVYIRIVSFCIWIPSYRLFMRHHMTYYFHFSTAIYLDFGSCMALSFALYAHFAKSFSRREFFLLRSTFMRYIFTIYSCYCF